MLSDDEQRIISERVQFELALRKQFSAEAKPEMPAKKDPWWEGKLALLIVGGLITGGLVPLLQDHQNNITWKRQNRFSTTEFRLQTMRDCLKEFALASTFAGEAFERGRRLLETRASPAALAAFDREFRDLQDRRFQQNARVSALMLYFKDGQGATAVYQRYVELSSDFLRQLETAVHLKASGATPDVDSLENAMAAVYGAAAATEDKIRKEIGMEEDENEKYRL